MDKYIKYSQKNIGFATEEEINGSYSEGFVFVRTAKGDMEQTRSLRLNLDKFELSSENRRILNKTSELTSEFQDLPLEDYSWEIHKMGKDFYDKKFGDKVMSASKIKEMFTDLEKSNMNGVLSYEQRATGYTGAIGYCLCYVNDEIIHYAYPFYDLSVAEKMPNIGLGMMIRAILWAKENGKKYIYLGSVADESSKYKLQFSGVEWWNNEAKSWSEDIESLKSLLAHST